MTQPAADGVPRQKRTLGLLAILIAATTTAIDGVAAAVALPTMSAYFAVDAATSTWVVNAFQLAVVTSLLPLAALGEIFGSKRLYLMGLVLFSEMSAIVALAPNLELLIVARVLQGVAAASIMSFNLAMVRFIMPPNKLGSAIGITAMAVAVGTSLAPSLTGVLLTIGSWRLIFGFSMFMGVVSAVIVLFTLPETPTNNRKFDFAGAVLSAMTFGFILLGVSSIGHFWHPAATGALLAAGVFAAVLLVRRLWDDPAPLLPLDLLRIPVFALSVSASLCAFSVQMATFVSLPFYLQTQLGFSVLEAGLAFAAWPVMLACTAPVAGMLADRFPAGLLGGVGMALLAAALLVLIGLDAGATMFDVMWPLAMAGLGFGLFQSPNNRTIVGSAPKQRSGAAGGALATARLIGQALGTALATVALSGLLGDRPASALVIASAIAALGACISLARRGKVEVT